MNFDKKYIKGLSAFAVTILCVLVFVLSYTLAEVMMISAGARIAVILMVFGHIVSKVVKLVKGDVYPLIATLKIAISTLILMRPLVDNGWTYILYTAILAITMAVTLPIYHNVVAELEHKYK